MNLLIQFIDQYLLPRHQFEYERVVLYVALVVLLVLVTLQAAVILGCGVRHGHMVTICTIPGHTVQVPSAGAGEAGPVGVVKGTRRGEATILRKLMKCSKC